VSIRTEPTTTAQCAPFSPANNIARIYTDNTLYQTTVGTYLAWESCLFKSSMVSPSTSFTRLILRRSLRSQI
jgi:hypothetical protein